MNASTSTLARSTAVLAVALGLLAAGCGEDADGSGTTPPDGTTATSTTRLVSPPPAEVLDAELVWFDGDGLDEHPTDPQFGRITDGGGLDAFRHRHVDGDPRLGAATAQALEDGDVLIGGVVSSGCFSADRAELVLVAGDVRLIPIGLPDPMPEIACVRAINSVALVAIDADDLPEGATVQGG